MRLLKKYNLYSLFSGAGGLDLGFILTGKFNLIFGNDKKESAAKTHSNNFNEKLIKIGECPNLHTFYVGNISEIDFGFFEDTNPDVVVGGPPCQDFSIIRGPEAGTNIVEFSRGRLYAHYIRALIHLQPKIFVFENVPGLKGMKGGFTYNTILEDFSKLNVRWTELKNLVGNNSKISPLSYELVFNGVVDASKLGVPQIRKRLIIIGLRRDLFQYNLEKIDRIKNNIQKRLAGKEDLIGKYPLTPLEVFEGRPLPELCEQYKNTMREYQQIIKEVETSEAVTWYETEWNKLSFDIVKDYLLINNISTPERSGELDVAFEKHAEILKELEYYNKNIKQLDSDDPSNNIPKESLSVSERMKKIPPDKNYSFVKGTEWDVVGKGIGLIYRRIHPLKPAYTVVAYGGGGTSGYHYEKSRGKLTNRERARLQTFPDWFKFKGSFQQVRGQIGEAVPVLLAKRIAEVVVEILEGAE